MLTRRVHPRRTGLAVMAIATLSAVPSYAQDGAEKVYRQGVEAIERQRWAEAASLMRQAIAMNGTEAPGERGFLGFRGRDYLPHLLLGRALFSQGDCTGALTAWEVSDRQGVVRRIRNGEQAKEIDQGYSQCESKGFLPAPKYQQQLDDTRLAVRAAQEEGRRLAEHVSSHDDVIKAAHRKQVTGAESRLQTALEKLSSGEKLRRAQDLMDARAAAANALREFQASRQPLDALIASVSSFLTKVRAAETEVAALEAAGQSLEALLRGSPVRVAPSDATTAARTRADGLVVSAREKLRNARQTQTEPPLTEALAFTANAARTYQQARNEIEALIRAAVDRELQLVQTQMQNTLTALEARASDIAAALDTQPSPPGTAAKDLETAQRGLVRARQSFDRALRARDLGAARAAVQATPRVASQLDALAAALAVAAPSLPGVLRAAAQAFFDGSYADAVRLLPADQVAAIDQRFRIHGHIVRAAALFALYQRSGGADASLREQARREVEQSRALDPAFQPNPAAFSPRFLAFFSGATAQPQP